MRSEEGRAVMVRSWKWSIDMIIIVSLFLPYAFTYYFSSDRIVIVRHDQASRWQISMGGGPSPPNSLLFVRVPPYLHTKIFPMGGA